MHHMKMLCLAARAETDAKQIGLRSTVSNLAALRRQLQSWKDKDNATSHIAWVRLRLDESKATLKDETQKINGFLKDAKPNIVAGMVETKDVCDTQEALEINCDVSFSAENNVIAVTQNEREGTFEKIAMPKDEWKKIQRMRAYGIWDRICVCCGVFGGMVGLFLERFFHAGMIVLGVSAALITTGMVFSKMEDRIKKTVPPFIRNAILMEMVTEQLMATAETIRKALNKIENALGARERGK